MDINLALDTGYQRHPSVRALLIRKVECLISLGRFSEARRMWTENDELAKPNPDAFEDDRAQQRRLKFIDLEDLQEFSENNYEPNPLIQIVIALANSDQYKSWPNLASLSVKLSLMWDHSNLKSSPFLVTNADIQLGEILAVELPYLTSLLKQYELMFCHYCCAKLETIESKRGCLMVSGPLVSCTNCTRVLYCSSKCRDNCWAIYHRYECTILPLLHQIGGVGHLAFRLLVSTGLNTIRKVFSTAQDQPQPIDQFKLQDPTDVFSLYEQLYNLVAVGNPSQEELLKHKLIAIVLFELTKQAGFEQDCIQENEQLIRDIILRHILQLATNDQTVFCLSGMLFDSLT